MPCEIRETDFFFPMLQLIISVLPLALTGVLMLSAQFMALPDMRWALKSATKGVPSMMSRLQKEKAIQFRQFHQGPPTLVLPNAWDAASAYLFERVGFLAIATTSSGVAAAHGYADGQISRAMMLEVIERMTRVVECPLTVDIEAGHENTVDEMLQTIRAVIMAGAVGINIEDSTHQAEGVLVDVSFQV